MLLDIVKILGCLAGGCEIVCSMVGITYLFDYLLSNSVQNEHSRTLRELESDEFFNRVWKDCAKHGPVNLEDYNRLNH